MRTDGQTDRHDEVNSSFFFRSFAKAIYCSVETSKLNLLVNGTLKF